MKYYISDHILRIKKENITYSYGVMFGSLKKGAYGISRDRDGVVIQKTMVFQVTNNKKIWTEVTREECVAAIIKYLL